MGAQRSERLRAAVRRSETIPWHWPVYHWERLSAPLKSDWSKDIPQLPDNPHPAGLWYAVSDGYTPRVSISQCGNHGKSAFGEDDTQRQSGRSRDDAEIERDSRGEVTRLIWYKWAEIRRERWAAPWRRRRSMRKSEKLSCSGCSRTRIICFI